MEEQKKREYKKSTIIKVGADIKKSSKESHYVDNEKFYEALLERKNQIKENAEKGLPPPRVTDFIGKCLMDIANGLSLKYYFRSYPYRDDMVEEAVIHMLKNVDGFNTDVGKNPFSYFTQTAYYNFLDTIKTEKGELAVKFKLTMKKLALQEISEHDEDYDLLIAEENLPDISYISDFLKVYEASLEKKKKAAKNRAEKKKLDIADLGEANEAGNDN